MTPRKSIVVVGGGVIGLTTAAVLSQSHDVTIIASKFGIETESVKATAIWHVYLVPETELILNWAETTLKKLVDIHAQYPQAGIELIDGVELFRKQPKKVPAWSTIPPLFKMLSEEELFQYNRHDRRLVSNNILALCNDWPVRWGYRIRAPVAKMTKYLNWLIDTLVERGVRLERRTVDDLLDAPLGCDCVINCTGLGARELANDHEFVPYKGQYFVMEAIDHAPIDYVGDDDFPTGMSYVIIRGGEVMVGGSAEEGVEDLAPSTNWSAVADRAGVYVPWLKTRADHDPSRRLVVCIRPARAGGVRLEKQLLPNAGTLIHNYGHGGSGFSLSWGCAEEVARLIANGSS